MNVQWYEQHLQNVVKENQQLKYGQTKNKDIQLIGKCIRDTFEQLFQELPPLTSQLDSFQSVEEVIRYYRNAGSLWLDMVRKKMIIYQPSGKKNSNNLGSRVNSRLSLLASKQSEICLVCEHPKDKQIYNCLRNNIAFLESQIELLEDQNNFLKHQEDKYLKQIFKLRSITKKLEYQLAQQLIMNKKKEKISFKMANRQGKQFFEIRQSSKNESKVQLQIKKPDTFEDERVLLNTLYKEQKMNNSSSNGHLWIIQDHDPQSFPPSTSTTSRHQ